MHACPTLWLTFYFSSFFFAAIFLACFCIRLQNNNRIEIAKNFCSFPRFFCFSSFESTNNNNQTCDCIALYSNRLLMLMLFSVDLVVELRFGWSVWRCFVPASTVQFFSFLIFGWLVVCFSIIYIWWKSHTRTQTKWYSWVGVYVIWKICFASPYGLSSIQNKRLMLKSNTVHIRVLMHWNEC